MPSDGDELVGQPAPSTGRPTKTFGKGRVCKEPDCGTALSIYNKGKYCYLHEPIAVPRTRGRKKIA